MNKAPVPVFTKRARRATVARPKLWAIEVKNGARPSRSDSRGLRTFREDYPEATALLLHRGRERSLEDGVLFVSAYECLRGLRPGRPIA